MRRGTIYPYDETNSVSTNNLEHYPWFFRIRRHRRILITIFLTIMICSAIYIPLLLTLKIHENHQKLSTISIHVNVTDDINGLLTTNIDDFTSNTEIIVTLDST